MAHRPGDAEFFCVSSSATRIPANWAEGGPGQSGSPGAGAHRFSMEAELTGSDWWQRGKDLFLTTSLTESPLAPDYDRSAMTTGIVHMGVGGFHRAHEAAYLDRLMRMRAGAGPRDGGEPTPPGGSCLEWGICGVGLLPEDARMRDALTSQDHLYTLVRKHPGGLRDPAVIGSIHTYLFAPDDPEAVLALLSAPTTRIVSLTVTEGGYNVDDATGTFRTLSPGAVHDAEHPGEPTTTFGYLVEALPPWPAVPERPSPGASSGPSPCSRGTFDAPGCDSSPVGTSCVFGCGIPVPDGV